MRCLLPHQIKVLPTPGQYQYVSKYLIRDRPQLLAWLHKYRNGLRQSDIKDCYPGIVSPDGRQAGGRQEEEEGGGSGKKQRQQSQHAMAATTMMTSSGLLVVP